MLLLKRCVVSQEQLEKLERSKFEMTQRIRTEQYYFDITTYKLSLNYYMAY